MIQQLNLTEYSGQKLEYGKYLVVRDGKIHFEVYNNNPITHFYLPKVQ